MQALPPLSSWSERLRALTVLGSIGLISVLHVLTLGPAEAANHMASHGLHSAIEGLHYIPLLLAGYWWGRWPAGTCGGLVTVVYPCMPIRRLANVTPPPLIRP